MSERTASEETPAHSNNFHLLRLFAALQVVVTHGVAHLNVPLSPLAQPLHHLLSFFPGVPIFFVISGYLVSNSYLRSRSLKSYGLKRILRIYPGLWAAFLIGLTIVGSFGFLPREQWLSADFYGWCAAQLSFGQFYNPGFLRSFGVGVLNGSLWTIPVELGFYAILPFLFIGRAPVQDRRPRGAILLGLLLLATALASALTIVLDHQSLAAKILRVTPLPHLYLFLLGVVLQCSEAFVRDLLAGRFLVWLTGYILLMVGAFSIFGGNVLESSGLGPPLKIVLGLTIVSFGHTHPTLSDRLIGDRDISYGVYLYHMLFANALIEWGFGNRGLSLLLLLALSVVAGWISWIAVESPVLRLKRKLVPVLAVAPTGPAAIPVREP